MSDAVSSSDRWRLAEAEARFSELVRRVHNEGPQHVTLQGQDEVVVIAGEEFRRLMQAQTTPTVTGEALIAVLQASPYCEIEIEIEPERLPMPVRDLAP